MKSWKNTPGQADSTQLFSNVGLSQVFEFVLDHIVIKVHAVGHKDLLGCKVVYFSCDLPNGRRITYHLVVDPGESGYKIGDLTFRVHQAMVFIDHILAIMLKNGDLGDLVSYDPVPGGFYVDNRIQCPLFRANKVKANMIRATSEG